MRNSSWWGVGVTLSGIACLAAQEPKPLPGPGRIEGVVVDAMGRLVADAEVWLVDQALPHVRTAEGAFVLRQIPVGYSLVRAKASHWHRGTATVRVTDEDPLQFATVVLQPAADVDVRVVDDKGAAVSGAEVMCSRTSNPGYFRPERGESFVTDANGRVRLVDIALGDTAFHAIAPGFACASAAHYVGDGGEVVVRLARGQGFELRLVLAGASPEQLRAARWHLTPTRDGYGAGCQLPPSLMTGAVGADGAVTIQGLPIDMDFQSLSIVVPDAGVLPHAVHLPLGEVDRTRPHTVKFDVVAANEVPVLGVVRDPGGKPLAQLALSCKRYEFRRDAVTARTDASGAFRLERAVAAGETFELSSLDPRWVFDQPKAEKFEDLRYRGVFKGKLEADAPQDVRCVAAAEVRGRVIDAAGRGVAGVEVQLMADWDARRTLRIAGVTTDRDGVFVLPRLNPGAAPELWIEANGRTGAATSARFALAVGQTLRLPDLALTAAAFVEGTVVDAAGRPAYGASLRLQRENEVAFAIADHEGHFRLAASPGPAKLLCFLGHERLGDPKSQSVELRSGETLTVRFVRNR
jgi:protocatechuate 3,4-dioxygenase beta subunit